MHISEKLPSLSYICLINIIPSPAQSFPLNKQSADFITGFFLTYYFKSYSENSLQRQMLSPSPNATPVSTFIQNLSRLTKFKGCKRGVGVYQDAFQEFPAARGFSAEQKGQ